MKEERKNFVSPLLCFDMYLEHYHKLLKTYRKDADLRQLTLILGEKIGTNVQNMVLYEEYDALVLTKADQNILWVNNGFSEMTGYSKNFAMGKRPSFLQGTKTSLTVKREIREQLESKHSFSGSIINYRKNGETYLCQVRIVPIYGSNGEVINFLALERELLVA